MISLTRVESVASKIFGSSRKHARDIPSREATSRRAPACSPVPNQGGRRVRYLGAREGLILAVQ
jgi:hypothetical protein